MSVPFAPPPKYGPEVIGIDQWTREMEAHQRWLNADRQTSDGPAVGGAPDPNADQGKTTDDADATTQPPEDNEQEPPVKKRKDSGKPGTFNVYADIEGCKTKQRIGEKIDADSPTQAMQIALDGSSDSTKDAASNLEARRLRGSSVGKGEGTAKLDGAQGGESSDQSADIDAQAGQGQGDQPKPEPQADDIIIHRLQSAPLIGQEAEAKISAIAMQSVMPVVEKGLAELNKAADAMVNTTPELDVAKVEAIVDEKIAAIPAAIAQNITITYPDASTVEMDGHFHPVFKDALHILAQREPVYLYGPSGTGKTFMAEQLAAALFPDMDAQDRFYGLSATMGMSESHLQGWRLPISAGEFVYVPSEFVKRYENGGLFLLDEVDRADPNVLAVLNQALANGRMPLPARFEKPFAVQSDNFCMMCGGNTAGTGADRLYSAATRLDEAFLDRFRPGTLYVDYDQNLEQALVGDTLLLKAMWQMRKLTTDLRIERVISTRAIVKLHKLFDGSQRGGTIKALKRLQTTWEPSEISKVKPNEIVKMLEAAA